MWLIALAASAMATAQGKAPATEGEKAVYAVYQRSLEADRLFGQSKYAEAQPIYAESLKRLLDAVKREPDTRYYEIPVKPTEMPIARALDLDVDEITKPGSVSMTVVRFAEVMEAMESHALQVMGKDPNWEDSLILDRAVGQVLEVDPPVPDDMVVPSIVRLRLAVDKLEALFRRNSKLKEQRLRETSAGAALEDGKSKLAALAPLADAAKSRVAATMPMSVKLMIDTELTNIGHAEEGLGGNGFIDDMRFERYVVAPEKSIAEMTEKIRAAYAAEGKTMPADAMKPISDRLTALRKQAIQKAGSWKWPADLKPDPKITARVKAQLTKNVPGVKVLKIGMRETAWSINKNDVGIPEDRYRSGLVLYVMPGESLPRCSVFIYREQYAGGGTYTPADGASSYPGTRWQKA
jgi:hypothetical protein